MPIATTYVYDSEKDKVVKKKDRKKIDTKPMGEIDEPYYDVGLDEVVKSKRHKRELLKKKDLHIVDEGEKYDPKDKYARP